MSTTATETHKLKLDDLGGLDAGKYSGGQRRFYCPIHGGDHQRSLSIVDDGDMAGVGHCHSCHARVVVIDWPGRPDWQPQKQPTVKQIAAELLRRASTPAAPKTTVQRQRSARAVSECETLRGLDDRMQARAKDARAVAYLAGRGLPIAEDDTALLDLAGLGYVPADARLNGLGKWCDRLIFPLWSPAGVGYVGRALWGWQPGMDEYVHKQALDDYEDTCNATITGHDTKNRPITKFNAHRRWEKTDPAGWYGPSADDLAATICIVEGALDRLALLAAGMAPQECIALIGTASAAAIDLLPRHVTHVILALDADEGGQEAAQHAIEALRFMGIKTAIATAPDDGLGKDASERYRRASAAGLAYVWDAWATLHQPASLTVWHHHAREWQGISGMAEAPATADLSPKTPIMPPAPKWRMHPGDAIFPAVVPPPDRALDDALMGSLFARVPWYDASAGHNAASQAAMWVCAGEARPGELCPMPNTMAAYALLLHAFAAGAAIAMTDDLAGQFAGRDDDAAPGHIGLIAFVSLLRRAYRTRNRSLARACVDAVLPPMPLSQAA